MTLGTIGAVIAVIATAVLLELNDHDYEEECKKDLENQTKEF